MGQQMKQIVEALLFVADAPLSLAQLGKVLETEDRAQLKAALDELQADYQNTERAFDLVEVAGGYRLRTRPELAFWLRKLRRQQVTRLSTAALETLAVIAYKQPVLKAEIERLRGVEVSGVLRLLMEKDLVKVVGRKDLPGRPLIYGTTRRFLETFDLKDLKDLPTLQEMEAILGEAGQMVEGEEAAQGELELIGPDEEEALEQDLEQDSEPYEEVLPDDEGPSPEGEPYEAVPQEKPGGQDEPYEPSQEEESVQESEPCEVGPEQKPDQESEPLEQTSASREPEDPEPQGESPLGGKGAQEKEPKDEV